MMLSDEVLESKDTKALLDYLKELLTDRNNLLTVSGLYTHVSNLLEKGEIQNIIDIYFIEITKTRNELLLSCGIYTISDNELPEPKGSKIILEAKIFVPDDPEHIFNFVGRILGPEGSTVKCLQQYLGVKIMIRGQGSLRDKKKEEANIGRLNWEHLNENLHVLISVEDFENRAKARLLKASEYINLFLKDSKKMSDKEDKLKQIQLMELSICKETRFANPHLNPLNTYGETNLSGKPDSTYSLAFYSMDSGYDYNPDGSLYIHLPHNYGSSLFGNQTTYVHNQHHTNSNSVHQHHHHYLPGLGDSMLLSQGPNYYPHVQTQPLPYHTNFGSSPGYPDHHYHQHLHHHHPRHHHYAPNSGHLNHHPIGPELNGTPTVVLNNGLSNTLHRSYCPNGPQMASICPNSYPQLATAEALSNLNDWSGVQSVPRISQYPIYPSNCGAVNSISLAHYSTGSNNLTNRQSEELALGEDKHSSNPVNIHCDMVNYDSEDGREQAIKDDDSYDDDPSYDDDDDDDDNDELDVDSPKAVGLNPNVIRNVQHMSLENKLNDQNLSKSLKNDFNINSDETNNHKNNIHNSYMKKKKSNIQSISYKLENLKISKIHQDAKDSKQLDNIQTSDDMYTLKPFASVKEHPFRNNRASNYPNADRTSVNPSHKLTCGSDHVDRNTHHDPKSTLNGNAGPGNRTNDYSYNYASHSVPCPHADDGAMIYPNYRNQHKNVTLANLTNKLSPNFFMTNNHKTIGNVCAKSQSNYVVNTNAMTIGPDNGHTSQAAKNRRSRNLNNIPKSDDRNRKTTIREK